MSRSILVAALAAIFAAAAVQAGALVFSDRALALPRAVMASWERGETIGTHRSRQRLLDRITMAIAARPDNADAYLDLGRLYAWHASLHPRGSERHQLFGRRALAAFGAAARRRPGWGYAWVRIAEQRAGLGGRLTEIWPLLSKADAHAPREPETQLKLLWVGLRWWKDLDAQQRERLVRSARRLTGEGGYAVRTRRILAHYGLDSESDFKVDPA